MDAIFRSATPAPSTPSAPPADEAPSNIGGTPTTDIEQPIENPQEAVLSALDIQDDAKNLPEQDRAYLGDVASYITDILKAKGVAPTQSSINRTLIELKFDMGLDLSAEPSVVLDRIGGVIQAWKSLTFISDPREKRSLFMKLARQPDSSSMHRLIFEEMERRKVWR